MTADDPRKLAERLSDAQRAFMLNGSEGIFCDHRIARALCGKGLMAVAGHIIGETVYAFTETGLGLRAYLRAQAEEMNK